MNRYFLHLFILAGIILGFSSCRTSAPLYNYKELAKASARLGMDIGMNDNHRLYIEVSKWMGTPYQYAGNTKNGVDCSGFTTQVYQKVYAIKLERSSETQRNKDCKNIGKGKLKEGDLVFFSDKQSKGKATHAGIFLKNNKFVHASTNRGVIVSDLNEEYYRRYWLGGGRVK